MGAKKIYELVAAAEIKNTDLFVMEQDGTAKKITGATLKKSLGGSSGGGASSWYDLLDTPFGTVLETQTCTYTGEQYNESVVADRIGDAPVDLRYLYGGEVSATFGDMTKTVSVYPGIFASDASDIPDNVDGVFLCKMLGNTMYSLHLRDTELYPDGMSVGYVLIQKMADSWPTGIYAELEDGTNAPRMNSLVYATVKTGPPAVTALDFSGWDGGSFKETLEDGTENEYAVTFDSEGNPTNVGGIAVTWG